MGINRKKTEEKKVDKKWLQKKLALLVPVFARASIGDFSKNVNIPENEDELTELYVGVQIMLEVIREKIQQLEELNTSLETKVKEKTAALEEAQTIAHIGNWTWDIEKDVITWSDELHHIFGIRPGDKKLDYQLFLSYIHPDDRNYVHNIVQHAYQYHEPFSFYHRIIREDGTERILHGRGSVIINEHKQPVRMIGTGQDVTELKITEQALQEANVVLEKRVEERTKELDIAIQQLKAEIERRKNAQAKKAELAEIVQYSEDAIMSKNLLGYITTWNKGSEKMYGYKAKEIIGKHISLIVPEAKQEEEIFGILEKVIAGKSIAYYETIRIRKDGKIIDVLLTVSPIKNAEGKVIGASSIAKDITYRKKVENELKESQHRLSDFMNSATDIFWLYDKDFNLLDINKAGLKLLGIKNKKQLLGKHLLELSPGIKESGRYAVYRKVIKTGKPVTVEDFKIFPLSGEKYFRVTAFRVNKGLGIIERDVTEEKKYELRLLETETLKSAILDSSLDAIITIDTQSRIVEWNKGAEKIFGYSREEIIGKDMTETIMPERYRAAHRKGLQQYLKTGKGPVFGKSMELSAVRKDGTEFPMEISISPTRLKGRILFTSTLKDITERKKIQDALQVSEEQYRTLVETMNEGVLVLDNNDIIQFSNHAFCHITGYTTEEIIGKKTYDLFLDEEGKKSMQQVTASRGKGVSGQYEIPMLRKDGSQIWMLISSSPIYDNYGKIIGSVGVHTNISQRKQYEEDLDAMARFAEEDPNPVLRFSTHGQVLMYYNKAGKELINFLDKEENKKVRTNWVHLVNEIFNKGEVTKQELDMGNRVYMCTLVPIRSKKYVNFYATDITQKKQAEEKFRIAVEASPTSMVMVDQQGKIVLINSKTEEIFGYQRNELLGKSIEILIPERFRGHHPQFRQNFMADPQARPMGRGRELFGLHKNGTEFPIEIGLSPVRTPEGVFVLASVLDITFRKKSEAEIRKLSFMLSKTDNALLITDSSGKIQWVNEGFERLSGYTLAEVKDTSGEILRKGKQTGISKEHPFYKKVITEKQSVSYESRNYRKDGTEYWAFSTLTPILNDKNEVENIVVVDADITARKKAEQAMFKAKKLAEESAKAKELFLANMSHEIRTPMNAIMGIIQLMEDTPLIDKQKEYLKSANYAGENLLSIINDVLDLAKIESGKVEMEKIEFNPNEIIDRMMTSMWFRAKEKNIQLITEVDTGLPQTVVGDPMRLNQILANLIGNAIKFTEEGYVKLKAGKKEQHDKTVILWFEVEDTGIGIPKEKQLQIFIAFEQAHKEATRKYGGTGLGLSIVKRLVKMQNGNLSLKSQPGKGAVFTFEIPYQLTEKTAPSQTERKPVVIDASLKGKNILLVEDNTLNQMVAENFLKGMGINVTIAKNGREAVRLVSENDYDLVLMDIQMPEMDGYEATQHIRKVLNGAKGNNLPIVAMTAHAFRGEEEKCLKAGMNDYLAKPLKREILYEKLVYILKTKKDITYAQH